MIIDLIKNVHLPKQTELRMCKDKLLFFAHNQTSMISIFSLNPYVQISKLKPPTLGLYVCSL